MYTVPKADGKGERDTTLRDARKLNLVPSVTTILGIVDKPALTRWKSEQLLKAVYENPYRYGWDDNWEQHKRKLYSLSEKEGKDAAERGNEIHNALEQYFSTGVIRGVPADVYTFCTPAIKLIADTFGHMASWNAEHSFSHKLGFGGKCDLHMQPCGEFPNGVIIDFKTKSAQDFSKVKAYPEQCQQLVAYREGFNMPDARCFNLFIGTNTPGELLLHEWEDEDCDVAWRCFKHLVQYWKLINNFVINT